MEEKREDYIIYQEGDKFRFYQYEIDSKYGYIFKEDKIFFEKYLKDGQWNNKPKGKEKNCFQLGLIPQQIIGDINNAEIFLLNLNPSFDEKDFINDKVLEKYLKDTLKLDYSSNLKEYPFYFLNPKLEKTTGSEWWNNGHHFNSYNYDKRILAKKFCCIELIPYHARKLPIKEKMLEFPSVRNVKDYVKNILVPRAKRKEIVIICLRSKKYWEIENEISDDNNIYLSNNIYRANFSLNGKYSNKLIDIIEKKKIEIVNQNDLNREKNK